MTKLIDRVNSNSNITLDDIKVTTLLCDNNGIGLISIEDDTNLSFYDNVTILSYDYANGNAIVFANDDGIPRHDVLFTATINHK